MANKTKQQLIVENNTLFPTNNAGAITADDLRAFNTDIIDSTVNQDGYTTDSASFDARIEQSVVTASLVGDTLTFERENGNTFAVTITGATLPPGTVSGSSQINYPQISNIPSGIVSGSSQVSSITGSSLVNASAVSNVLTFTKGDSSTFNVTVGSDVDITSLNQFTASQLDINSGYNTFTQSADSRLDNIELETSSLQSQIDGLSGITGSYATTGSNVFVGNQTITGSLLISGSEVVTGPLTASRLQVNGNTDLNGQIDVSNNAFFRADVYIQSAGAPFLRIRDTAGGGNSDGFDIGISTASFVIKDDTHDINFFEFDYDGVSKHTLKLEANEFQLNSGSVIIEQDLTASLQEGFIYVGNGSGKTSTISTGSFAKTDVNNNFTGTQTFNNIAVNGTASFAYIESVTGSAKIIGDAFIILNNNTPTERYAGVAVIDSGSINTTASFQFDGLTNDWFYEYTDDGGITVDHGVALFGPAYNTIGNPTYPTNNRIQKGNGGHHILDSNISDDGTNVSINSNTQITGSLLINGQSPLINSDIVALNDFTQSQISVNTNLNAFTASASGRLNNIELTTASLQSQINGLSGITGSYATTGSNTFTGVQTITGSASSTKLAITSGNLSLAVNENKIEFVSSSIGGNLFGRDGSIIANLGKGLYTGPSKFAVDNGLITVPTGSMGIYYGTTAGFFDGKSLISFNTASEDITIGDDLTVNGDVTASVFTGSFVGNGSGLTNLPQINTGSFATTGSNTFNGNQIVNGTLTQNVTAPGTDEFKNFVVATGANVNGRAYNQVAFTLADLPAFGTEFQDYFAIEYYDSLSYLFGSEVSVNGSQARLLTYASGSSQLSSVRTIDNYDGTSVVAITSPTLINLVGRTIVTGSLNVTGTLTASLQEGYIYVGNSSNRTTAVSTGSFATTSGNTFNGNQEITGSFSVSGSVNTSVHTLDIVSQTASLDGSKGNMFVLNLVSATDTRLEVSNLKSGQTINLLVSQSSTGNGTLTTAGNLLEPSGSEYSASLVANAQDLLTLATFFNPDVVYVANIKTMI